jgi:hypothetical protein
LVDPFVLNPLCSRSGPITISACLLSFECDGVKPSLTALKVSCPDTYEVDGIATSARLIILLIAEYPERIKPAKKQDNNGYFFYIT